MHIDFALRSSNTGLRGRSLHTHHGDACCHRRGTFGQNKIFTPIGLGFRHQIALQVRPKPVLGELLSSSKKKRQKSRMHFYRSTCRSRIPHAYLSGVSRGFRIMTLRPFLIQSDSASRKRPFTTGFFFDCNLLVLLLIVSRIDS